MAIINKNIPWDDGTGHNLTVTYNDSTIGSQTVSYTSPVNEGVDREMVLIVETVQSTPVTSQQLVINEGMRYPLYSNEPQLVVPSDVDTFNVLKGVSPVSIYSEVEIQTILNRDPSYDASNVVIYDNSAIAAEILAFLNSIS